MQLIVETGRNCLQPREIASLCSTSSLQLSPDSSLWKDDEWLWESSAVSWWSRLDLTFLHCALKQFAVSPCFAVSHEAASFLSRLVKDDHHDGWGKNCNAVFWVFVETKSTQPSLLPL